MLHLVTPDFRVESVLDLDVDTLGRLGLTALLLDIDCTLKRYPETELSPAVLDWLQRLRAAGIGVCLVSNGRKGRIRTLAEAIGVPVICQALKPLPNGCRRAIRELGFDAKHTAMVGDQIFADVMAGRLAGLTTILVRPIHPEEEHWFTRVKRPFERILLRRLDRGNNGMVLPGANCYDPSSIDPTNLPARLGGKKECSPKTPS